MTIDATHRSTYDAASERHRAANHPSVPERPALNPTRRRNGTEEFIPVKQVLRWQDDGGAVFPDAG